MPLGIPLPQPPPARPSRLSWPGPRRLPRTIMPSTAAGGGRGPAVATGPGAEVRGRLFQAREGGAAASGLRPPVGRAGTMNQGTADSQRTLLLGAGQPGKSLRRGRRRLHYCSRCSRRRRLPGHGPAQPLEREGGRGSWELSFLPSVLSLKSNSLPRGGARARGGGPPGGRAQLSASGTPRWCTWAAGAASPRRWPGLALGGRAASPAHLPSPRGRGCGRGWRGRSRVSRGGRRTEESGGRPPRRAAPRPAGPSRLAGSLRAARRPGGTPSGPARPAARSWRWRARVPARRLLSVGPAHRTVPPGGRGPGSEGPRGAAAAARLGPGFCHFFFFLLLAKPPTSERAGEAQRKGGGRRELGDAASSPLGTSECAACPPARPLSGGSPGPDRASPPPPPLPRPGSPEEPFVWRHRLSFKSRFLLPLPPPPRRCRMLARCAAPPPGSRRAPPPTAGAAIGRGSRWGRPRDRGSAGRALGGVGAPPPPVGLT